MNSYMFILCTHLCCLLTSVLYTHTHTHPFHLWKVERMCVCVLWVNMYIGQWCESFEVNAGKQRYGSRRFLIRPSRRGDKGSWLLPNWPDCVRCGRAAEDIRWPSYLVVQAVHASLFMPCYRDVINAAACWTLIGEFLTGCLLYWLDLHGVSKLPTVVNNS